MRPLSVRTVCPRHAGSLTKTWGFASLWLFAVVVSGCDTLPLIPTASRDLVPDPWTSISVVERGWHTDIAIPVGDVLFPVLTLGAWGTGARYWVFGLGDQDYFMSHDETLWGTLSALFPGPAVVLVTALTVQPEEAFGSDHTVTIRLKQSQLLSIAMFIRKTLVDQATGAIVLLGEGPYPGSMFYRTNQTYDAFHNCNSWTLKALKSAGFPVNPSGVLLVGQVMKQAHFLQ